MPPNVNGTVKVNENARDSINSILETPAIQKQQTSTVNNKLEIIKHQLVAQAPIVNTENQVGNNSTTQHI